MWNVQIVIIGKYCDDFVQKKSRIHIVVTDRAHSRNPGFASNDVKKRMFTL